MGQGQYKRTPQHIAAHSARMLKAWRKPGAREALSRQCQTAWLRKAQQLGLPAHVTREDYQELRSRKAGGKRVSRELAIAMFCGEVALDGFTKPFRSPLLARMTGVPGWVPADLVDDYRDMTRLYGEETAASQVRRLKAEAQQVLS